MQGRRMYLYSAAAIALCGAAISAAFLLQRSNANAAPRVHNATSTAVIAAATGTLTGDAYDVADCTDLIVVAQPGYILSATEKTAEGSIEADLKTTGWPVIDGSTRNPDQAVDWGEEVDLGAFKNAGSGVATVTFSSRLIVEVLPGEAIFTSSSMTEAQIETELAAHNSERICRCFCECTVNGELQVVAHYVPCNHPEVNGCENCHDALEHDVCECDPGPPPVSGVMERCGAIWRKKCD